MTIKLKGSSDGSVSFDAPADTSPSGSDIALTLPTSAGSANQFLKNSGTAGTLEYSSMVETSTGVGIGTSSPSRLLTIQSTGNANFCIKSANTGVSQCMFGDTDSDVAGNIAYRHSDDAMTFEVNSSERARINSAGNVAIGTTGPYGGNVTNRQHFTLNGTNSAMFQWGINGTERGYLYADATNLSIINTQNGYLRLNTNNTERFRLTNKGFVKAGPRITDSSHGVASLTSARHEFTSDDNGWTIIVTHTSGAASEHEGILIDYNLDPNGTGNSFLQGNANSNTRFRMASNGGLYNYQSNNSNLCDEREKKNIVNLDTKWDKVKSWDLKKFHYNEDADDDDLRYGVIAQQVEQHCPELITDWAKQSAKDAVLDEDGNVVTPAVDEVTRKGVKEQQMMWMAIKALQEAQTRIETLETQHADLLARVAALEAA